MKVLVIGSGLAGLTSAYFLVRAGCDVTIVDRQLGPGLETSFANGALLTPSMADPWNAPGCWRVLLGSLLDASSPLQLRIGALPSLIGWGATFLRNSSPGRYHAATITNLKLALRSMEALDNLVAETGIEFRTVQAGTLRIFKSDEARSAAVQAATLLSDHGIPFDVLDSVSILAIEPALGPIATEICGGIIYGGDRSGDAYLFCRLLANWLAQNGVQFRFGTRTGKVDLRGGRVASIQIGRENFTADCYLVAAGSESAQLLSQARLDLPVRPAKGYSVTLPVPDGVIPRIPVVDDALHAAVVPLDRAIRAVGTAEFAGFDRRVRSRRIANLLSLLRRIYPKLEFDHDKANAWCGLRPMSADGVPIIGVTPLPNLFVNTGQGHLGWTMAAASGELVAQLIAGQTPTLSETGYAFGRFSARTRTKSHAIS